MGMKEDLDYLGMPEKCLHCRVIYCAMSENQGTVICLLKRVFGKKVPKMGETKSNRIK